MEQVIIRASSKGFKLALSNIARSEKALQPMRAKRPYNYRQSAARRANA